MQHHIRSLWIVLAAAALATAMGCDREEEPSPEDAEVVEEADQELSEEERLAELQERANAVFEPIPQEVDDVDWDKVELGRALFHDKGLSADETVSCATCHAIEEGGDDGLRVSIGIHDQEGPINSPTVLNSRYHFVQFWDGREETLEDQAKGPIEDPLEMGNDLATALEYLEGSEVYREAFTDLYEEGITEDTLAHAIAEFERTLITPDAPFDDFLRGDKEAMDEDAIAGLEAFMDVGCTSCHGGKILSTDSFQKMGLVNDTYFEDRGTEITDADLGRYNVTGDESDKHYFKVPTLRNVALTGPYYHDGMVDTLEEAVETMAYYQLGRELDEETVDQMVAFMHSLTGEIPEVSTDPMPEL